MFRLFLADPGLGAVGGEAVLDGSGVSTGVKRLFLTPNGFVQGHALHDASPTRHEATVIASCNLMLRWSDFRALGGFDPFYFFFYEDIDLTWRLHCLGRRAAVLSPMPVLHLFAETVRVQRLWLHARNRMYFCVKTLPAWRVLLLPLLDLAFLFQIDNVRRLLRRARQTGPAVSLVTEDDSSERGVSLRRAVLLLARVAGMILLGYLALPRVLAPARKARLRARRHSRDPAESPRLPAAEAG
jgi:GT2 family glycosyltransferase